MIHNLGDKRAVDFTLKEYFNRQYVSLLISQIYQSLKFLFKNYSKINIIMLHLKAVQSLQHAAQNINTK